MRPGPEPFDAVTQAMWEKDPELYSRIMHLPINEALATWWVHYPEDFSRRFMEDFEFGANEPNGEPLVKPRAS